MTRTDRQARRHFFTVMAALPLLAALAFAPEGARAQWATNGNDIHNTNTGNVGVGTDTPISTLHVKDTAHSTITFEAAAGAYDGSLLFQRGGVNQWFLQARNSGAPLDSFALFDAVNGVFRLTVNRNGNVGVGTSAPDKLLTVQGQVPAVGGTMAVFRTSGAINGNGLALDATGTGNNNLGFSRSGVTKASLAWDNSRNFLGFVNMAYSDVDFGLRLNADGSLTYHDGGAPLAPERLRVTAAGSVGVGTSPAMRLHVSTAAANDGFRLDGNSGAWATLVTNLGNGSYNGITANGDRGIVYGGTTVGSPGGGLVIVPWANAVSGIRLDPAGNVGIGMTAPGAKLHVAGDVIVDGNIAAKFQDVAEWVPSRERLRAGTVVVLDTTANNHVVASTSAYDTGVAGVVSEQPGLILGEGGAGKVMVATTGRVKVRVDATRAPVRIGDLLVTGDTPGVAMKSEPMMVGGRKLHAPGTIVGKALEPLAGGVGEILVLLSLQ